LSEFQSRMALAGMFLNANKTRILTNTNDTSSISILAIHQQWDDWNGALAQRIHHMMTNSASIPETRNLHDHCLHVHRPRGTQPHGPPDLSHP
jgi:hypothetical protein